LQTIACLHKLCDLALEAGKLREVLKDTEEIAQTLWSSIHGTVSIHLACNGLPWIERNRLLDRQLDILMAGILKT